MTKVKTPIDLSKVPLKDLEEELEKRRLQMLLTAIAQAGKEERELHTVAVDIRRGPGNRYVLPDIRKALTK